MREKDIEIAVSSFDRKIRVFGLNIIRFDSFSVELEELATFKYFFL